MNNKEIIEKVLGEGSDGNCEHITMDKQEIDKLLKLKEKQMLKYFIEEIECFASCPNCGECCKKDMLKWIEKSKKIMEEQ